jgi:peptide/nickel transport system permease protein
MGWYTLGRLAHALVSLLLMSVFVFLLARLTGDPRDVILPLGASREEYELAGRALGLDQPLAVQYLVYLGSVVRGDFGVSFRARRDVAAVIAGRVPATVQLGAVALAFSLGTGLGLGILAATARGRWSDQLVRTVVFVGQSVPSFWLGLLLIHVFAVQLRWLPSGGRGTLAHVVLPALTLGLFFTAAITRLVRSSLLEVLSAPYVQTARAKGLSETGVVLRHALRNALIPVTTYVSMILVTVFLAGSIATETIFSWPGMGQLVFQSVLTRDFPVVQALVLLFAALFILISLLVDLLYLWLDPRIRHAGLR